jgi:hypothetical protein
MGIFGFLGSGVNQPAAADDASNGIPALYSLRIDEQEFIKADVKATYRKILTSVLERTAGIPDKVVPLLWDNCVQSESSEGLITLLVTAMVDKADLFLVYDKPSNVLRKATSDEIQKIRKEYNETAESKTGVFISFKNYDRTDRLKIYSLLEFCILCSLNKTVNIAKAVQLKMDGMRSSVSLLDAGVAQAQGRSIATALRAGQDVMIDAKDDITTATPNIEPTEKAMEFLDAKRANALDLPISWINGEQTAGIGASGEADMRATEQGLKQYYFSIIKPVLLVLFECKTKFKSQDSRLLGTALEAAKTFELISDELISRTSKQDVLARLLDIDPKEEAKNLKDEATEREENPPDVETPPEGEPPQGAPFARPPRAASQR